MASIRRRRSKWHRRRSGPNSVAARGPRDRKHARSNRKEHTADSNPTPGHRSNSTRAESVRTDATAGRTPCPSSRPRLPLRPAAIPSSRRDKSPNPPSVESASPARDPTSPPRPRLGGTSGRERVVASRRECRSWRATERRRRKLHLPLPLPLSTETDHASRSVPRACHGDAAETANPGPIRLSTRRTRRGGGRVRLRRRRWRGRRRGGVGTVRGRGWDSGGLATSSSSCSDGEYSGNVLRRRKNRRRRVGCRWRRRRRQSGHCQRHRRRRRQSGPRGRRHRLDKYNVSS
mmetsp:Transcript_1509/g.3323  ORF Transcript_1509/g.3323 Transcript_1509/m.3323 type:complete len:290 (-) Transcript_1509:9-878(-)